MKLIDLLRRDRKRSERSEEGTALVRRVDGTDRSSMADLVRLLREADDVPKSRGKQPV